MRDQAISITTGRIVVGCDRAQQRAWLELPADESRSRLVPLRAGELLMLIEALAMAYAELHGARTDSAARGVNRTLRNRTLAARDRTRATGTPR